MSDGRLDDTEAAVSRFNVLERPVYSSSSSSSNTPRTSDPRPASITGPGQAGLVVIKRNQRLAQPAGLDV